ncbi:DNA glycosylase [Schizophyllum amplum]|uniref:Endonuclease III homolog n=1 Tax=Schizophyllum amplum TaxID=97359 RepID=A0A550CY57_9AGAR|nr:DNA glycosylase [Auriculariopsis ampla]
MRAGVEAAVDTMGCHMAQREETDPRAKRLTTLVSLMLSSQTKDEVVDAAVKKLRQALGGSITLQALLEADKSTISEAICKVGFWPKKTGYIMETVRSLRDDFDGDVPKTAKELCSLKGVGPKMAYLCLNAAWNIYDGIGVDVHVHRITNRLKWHTPPTKTPEATRMNLQSWLPKEFWGDINPMLVGFGQAICYPVNPRCDRCTLRDSGLCPSAMQVVGPTKRKPAKKIMASSDGVGLSQVAIELDPEVDKPLIQASSS